MREENEKTKQNKTKQTNQQANKKKTSAIIIR